MQGLHLTADLYRCAGPRALLTCAGTLGSLCRDAVTESGLTLVDERFHTFPDVDGAPGGVTGALLLAESHLAVHTWPERDGVTLDVYVCNFSTDNDAKAEQLLDTLVAAFAPGDRSVQRLRRGHPDDAGPARRETRAGGAPDGRLLLEWLNEHSAYGFRATRRLASVRSPFQHIEVFDTPQWGRLFRLDGAFMTSEGDEYLYHEPIVHAAAIAHPAPRSALVVGGGDGGSTEELLKHPTMARVVIAELDEAVIEVAREHLGPIHRGAFDDPRVEVRIGDGLATARGSGERFDLVVLDLTDPDTPARQLYTAEFFALAKQRLAPGGALALHVGSPIYQPERVRRLLADLATVFPVLRPMGLYVPLYGAYWGLAVAAETLDPCALEPAEVDARLRARGIADLRFLNGDTHRALFALPNDYRALLPGRQRPPAARAA